MSEQPVIPAPFDVVEELLELLSVIHEVNYFHLHLLLKLLKPGFLDHLLNELLLLLLERYLPQRFLGFCFLGRLLFYLLLLLDGLLELALHIFLLLVLLPL